MLLIQKIRSDLKVDIFDDILFLYTNNLMNSQSSRELLLNHFLINLMMNYAESMTSDRIKNCLLLALNLFMNDSPDLYSNIGQSIKETSKQEKKELINILRSEFIN